MPCLFPDYCELIKRQQKDSGDKTMSGSAKLSLTTEGAAGHHGKKGNQEHLLLSATTWRRRKTETKQILKTAVHDNYKVI